MTNRASATIKIGGEISAALVPALFAAIDRDGRSAEDGAGEVSASHIVSGAVLEIFGDGLIGGKFAEIESFCGRLGLAYVRTSACCPGAFEAERVTYTGTGVPRFFKINEAERVVLTRQELHSLGSMQAADAWFESSEFTPPPLTIANGEK